MTTLVRPRASTETRMLPRLLHWIGEWDDDTTINKKEEVRKRGKQWRRDSWENETSSDHVNLMCPQHVTRVSCWLS